MLDRAIESGAERRRGYRRSAAFDRTCRPHGGCEWCRRNRMVGAARMGARVELQWMALADGHEDELRAELEDIAAAANDVECRILWLRWIGWSEEEVDEWLKDLAEERWWRRAIERVVHGSR